MTPHTPMRAPTPPMLRICCICALKSSRSKLLPDLTLSASFLASSRSTFFCACSIRLKRLICSTRAKPAFTLSTSATWSSMVRFLWIMPRPPSCAMAMAVPFTADMRVIALAFAVAASANFPCVLLTLYWKRCNTGGIVLGGKIAPIFFNTAQDSGALPLKADVTGMKTGDVIIIDTESPSRDTLEQICVMSRDDPRPVVMFTHDGETEKIRAATRAGVTAYVVNGLDGNRLKPIMDAAMVRFEEYQAMRQELESTATRLAERKDIERAKGILMKQRGLDEEAAYQALRKLAMERGKRLGEIARQVVQAAELLS